MSTHHRRDSHTNYERLGWEAKNKGEFSKAIVCFDKALHYRQRPYFALHGKGECLFYLGDIKQAEECFNKAIQLNTQHPWAYHGLGRVYFFQGKYDTALAFFEKSIRLEPRGMLAWHWKGRTLIKLERYLEAEQSLLKALENTVRRDHVHDGRIKKIEADLKEVRELRQEIEEQSTRSHISIPMSIHTPPTVPWENAVIIKDCIFIQGDNNAPVNLKGNQANDDAVQNRATVNPTEKTGGEDEN